MSEIHPSHLPDDGEVTLTPGASTCVRCCRYLAFDRGQGKPPRITPSGQAECKPVQRADEHTEVCR